MFRCFVGQARKRIPVSDLPWIRQGAIETKKSVTKDRENHLHIHTTILRAGIVYKVRVHAGQGAERSGRAVKLSGVGETERFR